jgi:hypothetical protein
MAPPHSDGHCLKFLTKPNVGWRAGADAGVRPTVVEIGVVFMIISIEKSIYVPCRPFRSPSH